VLPNYFVYDIATGQTTQITSYDRSLGRLSDPDTADSKVVWYANPTSDVLAPNYFLARFNQAPVDISLSNSSVAEDQPIGTTVGTFSTNDPDPGNTFSYTLVSGTGGTDNGSFTITGTSLKTAASFNYEAKTSYSVRVRTTDQGGLWFEKSFTFQVTDVLEAPFGVIAFAGGSASGTTIQWTCEAGYSYQVQQSYTLQQDDWHDIGPALVANNGELNMTYLDTSSVGHDKNFYRISRTPLP